MTIETGGPAFPLDRDCCNVGMTLRDYMAAKAMQSLVTHFLKTELNEFDPNGWMDGVAMDSYSMADAMLKARQT
jgi:hypothetical protein